MYSDLRSFGGITNKEAASELLTDRTLCGNGAPRDRMAVVAYCVKCKEKKEMVDPQEGVTKNGRVITKGTCPDCGTKMSLIGGVAKK